jgi:RNA polymerase sigma-70 factor (ECF subfamily)
VTQTTLARARAGDEQAFGALVDPHRRELQLHCYRILGSLQDAEDVLQETLLAAWRALDEFEERASLRTWLYRIATNRALNALRAGTRRPREALPLPPHTVANAEPMWLEPYPDVLLDGLPDDAPGPDARYETKESVALAFVTALQRLTPMQRAVLVLRDVLGFRAAQTAEMLDTSETAVNSSLVRARTALKGLRSHRPPSAREEEIAGRYADAFEEADVERLVALLTDDALLTMPPAPVEVNGSAAIARFFEDRDWWGRFEVRLLPTRANGQPAHVVYMRDPHAPVFRARDIVVLTVEGDRVAAITRLGDMGLLARFGLPRTIDA